MLGKVPATRLRLIEKIVSAAKSKSRRLGGKLSGDFLRRYFRGVAEEEMRERGAATMAAAAMLHLEDGMVRRRGQTVVRVFNPELARDGFESEHTVIAIVCDDMPFLVDSLSMAVNRAGLAVHLLVHPVIDVRRDGRGRLKEIAEPGAPGSRTESWQLIEIDRETDAGRLAELSARLTSVLDDVRVAVSDWAAMRLRAHDLAASLGRAKLPLAPAEVNEVRALLDWMADNHFTFLGARYYRLKRGRSEDKLVPDAKSGLGLLRAGRPEHPTRTLTLLGAIRTHARMRELLVITKANTVATVHRATNLDYVGIKTFNARGEVDGEHRFLGLWTSTAYSRAPADIPVLRQKTARIVAHFGLSPQSHDGKAALHALANYPRDELFQASTEDLIPTVRGIVNLYDRQKVRLFVRRDAFQRFFSCLLYVPRDRYSTEVRRRIEAIVRAAYGASDIQSDVQLSESALARVHLIVRTHEHGTVPDPAAIERQIAAAVLTWQDGLRKALTERHDEGEALRLLARYGRAAPVSYQEDTPPAAAVADLEALEALAAAPDQLHIRLYHQPGAGVRRVNLKLYQLREPRAISDVLPTLENLGLRLINERPYALAVDDGVRHWIQDFELEVAAGTSLDLASDDGVRLPGAITALWQGRAENDGFNRLVLASRISWRETEVLRAYCRWLLQTGIPFSQAYMESVLAANARTAGRLARLFVAQFDPAAPAAQRGATCSRLLREIDADLAKVARLDEDRILRAFLATIVATLRTNYFQRPSGGGLAKEYLSLKIDPARVPGLPEPRPMFEIWLYSPRVEGVHLRKGRVARGGLRWSDRYEDFRTEVLGLMKAQNVKNTVIIPVGAKGGFVCRRLPPAREAAQQEVIACYQTFIRGLLDLTDNIVDGRIVPPKDTVRRDGDDPYLVVAADKGTATFSDIANGISAEYGFWLGDAFASGGSAGYDHKKIAITSRGAWEGVKRHFREFGHDTQTQEFTVAGIGDMSGDVFGNGLLRSPKALLVAAFNHQHMFIDPTPSAARGFAERQRLFNLPRSSWADYNAKLLSPGGGIWSRAEKSVRLTREARALLGITADSVPPNDVIKAILRLKVDLLWNGGIGTYVKASSETHAAVGDRANDAVRVDGRELRCRVVGEGGNLGFSQLGRVEYALAGGRLNTDFIDNSGGVNCSDLEVNIKILLRLAAERRGLRRPARDRLLARMTDEVSALVLHNNYLQTQAISTIQQHARVRAGEHAHAILALERRGDLDRALEYLPDDAAIKERVAQGNGLTRPELSILLAYAKIWTYHQIIESDLPEDPYLAIELERYFPTAIIARYRELLPLHPLRREIIATATTNSIVNRMGPTFAQSAAEESGASISTITRAYAIARESTAMREVWTEIEALDNAVPAAVQYEMNDATARALRHATMWLLAHRTASRDVEAAIAELRPGLAELVAAAPRIVSGPLATKMDADRARYLKAGVPPALAGRVSALALLQSGLYIVDLTAQRRTPLLATAHAFLHLGKVLELDGLMMKIEALTADGHWQSVARRTLRDNLYSMHRTLADAVLKRGLRGGPVAAVDAWLAARSRPVEHLRQIFSDMASGPIDFPTLSVALQALARIAVG